MSAARLLFSTGSLYVMDVAHCFALAAEAGFDGVEVMCDDRWSTRDPRYLAGLAERHRQPVLVCHTPFSPRLPGWRAPQDHVARIEQTLRLAEALGAETIVVHLPDRIRLRKVSLFGRTVRVPSRAGTRGLKAWFEEELRHFQRRTTVRLGIENMPAARIFGRPVSHVWWNTVPEWSRVHRWLTLDTTHWATHGVDPLDALRAAGDRLCHVHLSNYDGYEHQLPHKGKLNLKKFLRALKADGFTGTVSLELSPGSLIFKENSVMRHNLQASLDFTREHLG